MSGLGQPLLKVVSMPEVASEQVHANGTPTAVFHQPLLPSGLLGVKPRVKVGTIVSILIVFFGSPLFVVAEFVPSEAVQLIKVVPSLLTSNLPSAEAEPKVGDVVQDTADAAPPFALTEQFRLVTLLITPVSVAVTVISTGEVLNQPFNPVGDE